MAIIGESSFDLNEILQESEQDQKRRNIRNLVLGTLLLTTAGLAIWKRQEIGELLGINSTASEAAPEAVSAEVTEEVTPVVVPEIEYASELRVTDGVGLSNGEFGWIIDGGGISYERAEITIESVPQNIRDHIESYGASADGDFLFELEITPEISPINQEPRTAFNVITFEPEGAATADFFEGLEEFNVYTGRVNPYGSLTLIRYFPVTP